MPTYTPSGANVVGATLSAEERESLGAGPGTWWLVCWPQTGKFQLFDEIAYRGCDQRAAGDLAYRRAVTGERILQARSTHAVIVPASMGRRIYGRYYAVVSELGPHSGNKLAERASFGPAARLITREQWDLMTVYKFGQMCDPSIRTGIPTAERPTTRPAGAVAQSRGTA